MGLKQAQKEIKVRLWETKESYSRKVEQKLQPNNLKEVWEGMKTITGCKKSCSTAEGDTERANQFNHFFIRFDCYTDVFLNHPAHLPTSSTPIPSSQEEEGKKQYRRPLERTTRPGSPPVSLPGKGEGHHPVPATQGSLSPEQGDHVL